MLNLYNKIILEACLLVVQSVKAQEMGGLHGLRLVWKLHNLP